MYSNWLVRYGNNPHDNTTALGQTIYPSELWTEITSSAPFDIGALFVNLVMGEAGGTFQIGIGPVAGEQAITDPIMPWSVIGRGVILPLTIPRGQRVALLNNAASGTTKGNVNLRTASGRWLDRWRQVRAFNTVPVKLTTSGASNVPGPWVQVTGNSPACGALIVNVQQTTAGMLALDVAIGPSPQLAIIPGITCAQMNIWQIIDMSIPPGSTVWGRASITGTALESLYFQLLGVS